MTTAWRLTPQRLLVAVFVGAMFVLSAAPLVDTDLWWHLANGRYILTSGQGIPSADIYSYTAAGQPWVVHEWLTEVGMYGLYRVAGLTGLVLVAAALVAAGEWLLYRLLRTTGLGSAPAVVMAVVLGLAASPSWGARPQLLTFVLTALLVNLLLLYRQGRAGSPFWLVPLFVVWANLHPGFIFGAGVVLLVAVTEWLRGARPLARTLAIVAGAGAAAGLATPGGLGTYAAFYKVVASPVQRAINVEWQSPDFHLVPAGPALLLALILLLAGALAIVARRRQAPDLTISLLGIVSLGAALDAQRNVPLFAVAGAPLVGCCVAALLGARQGAARQRVVSSAQAGLNWGLLVVLVVVAVAFRVAPDVAPSGLDAAVRDQFPVAALDYADRVGARGPIFNQYEFGGYLIWRDYPARRVFIDGRAEVYGDHLLTDYFNVVSLSDPRLAVLDRYQVRTVILRDGSPLGAYLSASGWQRPYRDGVADVYTRAGG